MKSACGSVAELLNRDCDCAVTDLQRLRQRIDGTLAAARPIVETHPHLFSEVPVFLEPAHVGEMREVIEAVESVILLPGYQDEVLANSPAIARIDPRSRGVFMGFDFHIAPDGPKLIEINTNAGGAFLNLAALEAQRTCCEAADGSRLGAAELAGRFVSMFTREWSLARGTAPLRTIAIVDENPREQYLYPEFELAKKLFEAHGINARIADPSELVPSDDAILSGGQPIDLIYNRLTDFYLEAPANEALRVAVERGLAVVTPHPRAHALNASKRNLALFSDAMALEKFGATAPAIATLTRSVAATRTVDGCEDDWWRDRKSWFFKPQNGFGSRGAYRGDKLTRRVFAEITRGAYMAQALTPPSERWRTTGGVKEAFKVDVRCYVYEGAIQLMAARLYQGQTTNFRTAGGGFAPVYVVGGDE